MDELDALDLENPAWAFALDFYRRPGVAEACLTLQDQLNADIVELVVVLYAWSQLGMSLSETQAGDLRRKMQGWRETTVLPLRHIRRAMKPPRSDMPHETKEFLRDQVKRAELLAEQMQIAWANAWIAREKTATHTFDPSPVPEWHFASPKGDPFPESCTQALTFIAQTAIDMKQ
ncbi:MAG: TIGR02444 family protein [Caldilineaceae bacterium]|jgi:uncharacterized protein (TIGR02444 family)|uniref:TIGR02444 family protein n=1 Tax=Marivivens aquimaris TaxID=2774876 RepID=UPI00187E545A|nr:TIGR02444 family protein [Marivivens aquimaris]